MTKLEKKNARLFGARARTTALDFALGAAVGVLFFVLVYGVSTLNVSYDSWIYRGYIEEDIIQRYAGWLYFRAAPWEFPVVAVANNLSQPYGASITFMDSYPLLAVFFKLLSPVLPQTFQYIGWANLLNCLLQGGFAVLLLRRFKLSRPLACLASLFFVAMPVFVERLFRHDPLAAQWMVLAALLFYFRARDEAEFPFVRFLVLCVLAPATTTYFVPMVYVPLLAALLEYAFRHKKVARPALYFAACIAGTVAMAYPLGILTRGGDGGAFGYGSYSFNLNALFNPTSFNWYAESGNLAWSRFLPVLPQYHHQYDGFNYLGVGLLLGLLAMGLYALAAVVRALVKKEYTVFKRVGAFLKGHVWLLLGCAALTVFAVSNVVTWGGATLFTLPLPGAIQRVCAIFRASGRLFWPCAYLLALSVVVWCARLLKKHYKLLAIALLLAVQLADISGVLVEKHNYFAAGPLVQEDEFTTEGWIFMAQNYDNVVCLGNLFDYNLAAGLIRYNPNVQTNLVLTNRGSFPAIDIGYEETAEMLKSGEPLPDNTMYLASDEEAFNEILAGLHPAARGYNTGHYYIIANPLPGCPLPEVLPPAASGKRFV